ncbi:MAG: Fur family transcriptional regulator [Desulfovibrionaceae bacterium]
MNQAPEFRLSKQRKVILEELRKTDRHPTADELYSCVRKIIPRISLGTVYRNLEFLSSQGVIQKVGPGGPQMRFDGDPHPHPHIRCMGCDKVEDVNAPLNVPELDDDGRRGYLVLGVNLEYVGLCPRCSDAAKT